MACGADGLKPQRPCFQKIQLGCGVWGEAVEVAIRRALGVRFYERSEVRAKIGSRSPIALGALTQVVEWLIRPVEEVCYRPFFRLQVPVIRNCGQLIDKALGSLSKSSRAAVHECRQARTGVPRKMHGPHRRPKRKPQVLDGFRFSEPLVTPERLGRVVPRLRAAQRKLYALSKPRDPSREKKHRL